ncbi:hypothetical protein C4580_03360 [Candidatus Woesearchaeota archaeon]|nr:MAG: hypothetical protein C4580_03360 [Candidatus Woesearchaeota archaeon]
MKELLVVCNDTTSHEESPLHAFAVDAVEAVEADDALDADVANPTLRPGALPASAATSISPPLCPKTAGLAVPKAVTRIAANIPTSSTSSTKKRDLVILTLNSIFF